MPLRVVRSGVNPLQLQLYEKGPGSGGSGDPRIPWLSTDTLFTCPEELFAFPKKAPTKRIPKKQFQRILKEPCALMSIWGY